MIIISWICKIYYFAKSRDTDLSHMILWTLIDLSIGLGRSELSIASAKALTIMFMYKYRRLFLSLVLWAFSVIVFRNGR